MTPKGQNVLQCLWDLKLKLRRCPTMREIGTILNLSSATVQQHINKLYHDKYIKKLNRGVHPCNYYLAQKAMEHIFMETRNVCNSSDR